MGSRRLVLVVRAAFLAALIGAAGGLLLAQGRRGAAQPMPVGDCTVTAQMDVETKMRDGTILRSNVFTPDQPGPFPVILQRVPYNKDGALSGNYGRPEAYGVRCFIVVEQDVRGQYKSDGVWYPFRSEATDGYDTIEWAARLPKSNGKVGMYGFSYPGATQWLPATLHPPHLTAIVPAMTSSDYREGWTYEHGALMHGFTSIWPLNSIANSAVRHFPDGAALDAEFTAAQGPQGSVWNEKWKMYMPMMKYPPLHPEDPRVAPYFFDWLKHPSDDAYWQAWSIRRKWSDITVPALNFEGWYDIFVDGGIENFAGMRRHGATQTARDGQRLVVGPWTHLGGWNQKVGAIDFGPEAANPIRELQFRWFDYWLKGVQNGVDKEPRVKLFVMGANKWRTANEWPVEGTEFRNYYLHSGGRANTAEGNGSLDTSKPAGAGGNTPDKYASRSRRSRAEHRRPVPERDRAGTARSASHPQPPGRARLHDEGPRRGHGGDRAHHRHAVRRVVGDRHGLHGQAGRCLSGRDLDGDRVRHPAGALQGVGLEADADCAGQDLPGTRFTCGRRATSSKPAIRCASRSRAAASRCGIGIQIPAIRCFRMPRSRSRTRRSTTTPIIPR